MFCSTSSFMAISQASERTAVICSRIRSPARGFERFKKPRDITAQNAATTNEAKQIFPAWWNMTCTAGDTFCCGVIVVCAVDPEREDVGEDTGQPRRAINQSINQSSMPDLVGVGRPPHTPSFVPTIYKLASVHCSSYIHSRLFVYLRCDVCTYAC